MEIKTKYSVGDNIQKIIRRNVYGTCVGCNGSGKQTILETGKSQKCTTCCGHTTSTTGWRWEISEYRPLDSFIISHLQINVDNNCDVRILYSLDWHDEPDELEEDLFPTIESAQAECDRRNNAKVQS